MQTYQPYFLAFRWEKALMKLICDMWLKLTLLKFFPDPIRAQWVNINFKCIMCYFESHFNPKVSTEQYVDNSSSNDPGVEQVIN